MEKVRVFFDREGNTLSVWFDDPNLPAAESSTVFGVRAGRREVRGEMAG